MAGVGEFSRQGRGWMLRLGGDRHREDGGCMIVKRLRCRAHAT